jgi:hypothetical protein
MFLLGVVVGAVVVSCVVAVVAERQNNVRQRRAKQVRSGRTWKKI